MNHTRFPKEGHLPDCASRDNQVKTGDSVDDFSVLTVLMACEDV